MNPFAWNDEYSLDCPDIDEEHKALCRMAGHLYDSIQNGTAQQELATLFARLASYVLFHFEDEEALMRRCRYPQYEQHCREHLKLTGKIGMLEWQFRNGHANVELAAMELLKTWLENHVCREDQRVAEHLRRSKSSPAVPEWRSTAVPLINRFGGDNLQGTSAVERFPLDPPPEPAGAQLPSGE